MPSSCMNTEDISWTQKAPHVNTEGMPGKAMEVGGLPPSSSHAGAVALRADLGAQSFKKTVKKRTGANGEVEEVPVLQVRWPVPCLYNPSTARREIKIG